MADDEQRQGPNLIGVGVAIGAGIGAALLAATDNPVWIGVGAAIGAGTRNTMNSTAAPTHQFRLPHQREPLTPSS